MRNKLEYKRRRRCRWGVQKRKGDDNDSSHLTQNYVDMFWIKFTAFLSSPLSLSLFSTLEKIYMSVYIETCIMYKKIRTSILRRVLYLIAIWGTGGKREIYMKLSSHARANFYRLNFIFLLHFFCDWKLNSANTISFPLFFRIEKEECWNCWYFLVFPKKLEIHVNFL